MMRMNHYKFKLALLVIVVCGLGGISWMAFKPKPQPDSDLFEIKKNLDIFYDVYSKVEGMYVDEPKPGKLMKTGIDAMLRSLDPYTVFIPESKMEDLKFMHTGAYGGIGALITTHEDKVVITEIYEGFPADEAGFQVGDIIIKVDGKDVRGKSQSDISEILKGQPETTVEVTVARPGTEKPITSDVNRKKVQVPDVPYHGMVDDKTGYVKLNSFTATASSSVIKYYKELENEGMEQFVLDLRGNGGGLLIEAVKIVNMFVTKGQEVVSMKGRIENTNKTYKTREQPLNTEIPVCILVDGSSASASEIVSGSLQDLDRAVIVGTQTYGKGLVQQTKDIKYNSKIKITIAKYYTPSGRCIQKLDYLHKENGKAVEVPDSLITKFKTNNGRTVEDGRGITPDIGIEPDEISNLTKALIRNHIIFDFATKYRMDHPEIEDVENFHLSDVEFEAFKKFALDHEFDYSNESLKKLRELEKVAKDEKYLGQIQSTLDILEGKFTPNKSDDIDRYKPELMKMIENEIISRYYYSKGRVKNALKYDIFLKKAINIMNDRSEYKQMLGYL